MRSMRYSTEPRREHASHARARHELPPFRAAKGRAGEGCFSPATYAFTMTTDPANRTLSRLERSGALRLVDAEFARLLRQRLGASAEVALAGALAMRAVSLGHGGFVLAEADALLRELDDDGVLPAYADWDAALRDSPLVALTSAWNAGDGHDAEEQAADEQPGDARTAPLVYEHGRIALHRYARYEQQLARDLRTRAAVSPATVNETWLDTRIHALFHSGDAPTTDGDDLQAQAAATALRQRLTLLTGGPGTGKTTTVARILVLLHEAAAQAGEPAPRIALAAPTGRAAARLAEAIEATLARDVAAGRLTPEAAAAIPREAQTQHRLLGWQSHRVAFRHDARHPLPFDVVVVDEASMVDLPLMAKLVAAVPEHARLLLIGDPDQLPAVEAGDVLGALCAAADTGGPLHAQRVHLTHSYRQAGAQTLQAFADRVRRGDADAAIAQLQAGDAALVWREGNALALADTLRTFALPAYRALAAAADPAQALRQALSMRVLCALREGPFGARAWNAWFAAQLGARDAFFHGRLIQIAANSYRHGLFNGDVGILWQGDDGEALAWFDTGSGLRPWRPAQLPVHDSAFATTVHKAQGSEFDAVALVLPDADARVCTRELLYTGLTRARREALLWSPAAILRTAIQRRTHRDSGLMTRLQWVNVGEKRT